MKSFLIIIFILLVLVISSGLAVSAEKKHQTELDKYTDFTGHVFELKKRIPSMKYYPCTECHLQNTKAAVQKNRPRHQFEFHHMDEMGCFGCHDDKNISQLKLMNGLGVSFDNSSEVCGQCHGNIKRDWNANTHGKQIGNWLEKPIKFNCAECHFPHSPKFSDMKPVPPPPRPKFGIKKGEESGH